jgi:hypothetical protein
MSAIRRLRAATACLSDRPHHHPNLPFDSHQFGLQQVALRPCIAVRAVHLGDVFGDERFDELGRQKLLLQSPDHPCLDLVAKYCAAVRANAPFAVISTCKAAAFAGDCHAATT